MFIQDYLSLKNMDTHTHKPTPLPAKMTLEEAQQALAHFHFLRQALRQNGVAACLMKASPWSPPPSRTGAPVALALGPADVE